MKIQTARTFIGNLVRRRSIGPDKNCPGELHTSTMGFSVTVTCARSQKCLNKSICLTAVSSALDSNINPPLPRRILEGVWASSTMQSHNLSSQIRSGRNV